MITIIVVFLLLAFLVLFAASAYKQHLAEQVWFFKHGEIPNGFRLIYKGEEGCRLKEILNRRISLDEWLKIPRDIQDQIDF